MAIAQMMRYNQTGILMTQDCPREEGFRGRVRQAEDQRKHGGSLRCGTVFLVCFTEKSSPQWSLSNCPGGSKQRFIFQTIAQGKRNLHFWTISPKLLKELNLYWTLCKRERKRRCTRSAWCLDSPGKFERALIMLQELTIPKRASACAFAFLRHTE